MAAATNNIIGNADYFILMIFRVGGLIISSPIFGRNNVPQIAKIGFTFAVGYLLFTVFPQTADITYTTLIGFVLLCVGEMLLGVALSFVTNIFFSLTSYTAGQIIDMQIGFGIVNVYDVQNNMQAPMMGNVINLMLLMLFFAVDGHRKLIEMVALTIERMPIGTLVFSPNIGLTALEVFVRAFMLGVMMATPVLASGLTLEILFGLLMRAVPQIHMFVVGVPLKMLVGIIVYVSTLPIYAGFSARIFEELFKGVENMFAMFVT
ncbi:MAG: flagellar biosynthetic protein FliR [Oscillospiraceae bacterium]|nr:flagellar biosynthetic protein FliR [Oscillospiraceae bacterium]